MLRSKPMIIAVLFFASIFLARGTWAADPKAQGKKPAKQREATAKKKSAATMRKRRAKITVSRETTHLLEPLDDEGFVDYLAAMNRMSSKGVTPENNAAVLFVRAFGPLEIHKDIRDEYFERLGIEPHAVEGAYLSDFGTFLKGRMGEELANLHQKVLFDSIVQPWSAKDYPLVAQWLKANEKPMQLIVEGTTRPRCYFPLVKDDDSKTMMMVDFPSIENARAAARALSARAMLRLNDGKIEEAWQDLLACHRLSRLIGRHPTLFGGLVCHAIHAIAFEGNVALIEHGKLTTEQALKMQAALRRLAPLPSMGEKIDKFERFAFLDVVTLMAREGLQPGFDELFGGITLERSLLTKTLEKFGTSTLIDWDEVLRTGNGWYDRSHWAGAGSPSKQRQQKLLQFDNEMKMLRSKLSDPGELFKSFVQGRTPRKAVSRQMGGVLISLQMAGITQAIEAENRAATRSNLLQLGFALAAYRADRGSYPAELKQLTPKYIKTIPKDFYTEKPLVYKRQKNGFLLYSVGKNTKDDGGQTFDSNPAGDDIVLRIPVESVEQK